MIRATLLAAAAALSLGAIGIGATGASAAIVCHDQYQVSGGQEISTPYCNDNYLAKVARGHGFKVTDEAIRNNPALKDEVCRWAGSDIRIRDYCPDSGGDRGR